MNNKTISVIVPIYNELTNIEQLIVRLSDALTTAKSDLATTGNIARWFYASIGIGAMFLFLGLLLLRKRNSDMGSE